MRIIPQGIKGKKWPDLVQHLWADEISLGVKTTRKALIFFYSENYEFKQNKYFLRNKIKWLGMVAFIFDLSALDLYVFKVRLLNLSVRSCLRKKRDF